MSTDKHHHYVLLQLVDTSSQRGVGFDIIAIVSANIAGVEWRVAFYYSVAATVDLSIFDQWKRQTSSTSIILRG
jgi:hypothetical protein